MNAVTVDASVWIASQDTRDVFCQPSRSFLTQCLSTGVTLHVPAYARVEVACALARRLRDATQGEQLAAAVLAASDVQELDVNAALLKVALTQGTAEFVRGADALYAATATLTGSTLISWDNEHIVRAGGISPADWLTVHT